MSKELAQTVGGKKIAALFAILAALTVFATIWQSQPANASLTGTMTIADAPDPVVAGQTITYTATVTTLGASEGIVILTMDLDDSLVNGAVGRVTCPSATVGGAAITWAAAFLANNVATCTSNLATTAAIAANAEFTVDIDVPVTATSVAAPTGNMDDSTACTTGCTVDATGGTATTVTAASSASPASATNIAGDNHTITFSMAANTTCASDDDADDALETNGDELRSCAAGDVNLDGASLVSIGTVSDTNLANAWTVAVTIEYNGNATHNVSLDLVGFIEDGINDNAAAFTSAVGQKTYVLGELRHWSGSAIINDQDVPNDVRGHRHTACVVDDETNNGVIIPLTLPNTQINVSAGGGYSSINDPDPTFADVQIFVGNGTTGVNNATCFSWVSTEAGDQEISVNYVGADDGVTYLVDWDSDDDGNGGTSPSNDSLVKEWNVLEDSTLSATQGSTALGSWTGSSSSPLGTITVGSVFNPATSTYTFTPIVLTDKFNGSHVTRTGSTWSTKTTGNPGLWGVEWTATIATGSCGSFNSASLVTTASGTTGQPGTATVTVYPWNCTIGATIQVIFTGDEPGALGSGPGNEVTEIIDIKLIQPVATKQVFLAWAGQRVILEHDWRLNPGDVDGDKDGFYDSANESTYYGDAGALAGTPVVSDPDPDPVGVCAFGTPGETGGQDVGDFVVTYIKGAGPGNFVAGLGAVLNGSDQGTVVVDAESQQDNAAVPEAGAGDTDGDDIPGGPQDSCISRIIFESEDQGQVDVESFVLGTGSAVDDYAQLTDPLNQTKIAFVIYYMKLEAVNVSLVDDVAKPYHNSSILADWNPGNPWDASKDVTTVDWNVSKDLLVRARVKGWFTNSNPSGRAAGTDTNGGGLPAGRWVMPDDWPLLAGGPGDPEDGSDAKGIAEAYRPEFDIMIAPNNVVGKALDVPEGTGGAIYTTITALTAAVDATSTTIKVASTTGMVAGMILRIDNEDMTIITVVSSTTLTVDRGNFGTGPAAHAAGAIVSYYSASGVPFEGPYSLLDIPALGASAALSNWDTNNVRDTMWSDGDVDMWDAPMPPSLLTFDIRGAGWIKQTWKQDVYYLGTANSTAGQTYPNPFYIMNIPDSPFIPAVVAGGGYFWDSWGLDGPGGAGMGVYRLWNVIPAFISSVPGTNVFGAYDTSVTALQKAELNYIRGAYGDSTIGRTLVVYTDNHGEAMVTANGDFKLDYSGCAANALAGGKHCAPGDKVGASTITAVADYPDFRGKHYPLLSNVATVNWTWGGYKDVTIEDGETEQYKYVVFHGLDRDGFCYNFYSAAYATLLHPLLSGAANDTWSYTDGVTTKVNPPETVDFMIDSGEGIILTTSNGMSSSSQYTKQFAEGVPTFSTYVNDPAVTGVKEFPLSSLAATGAVDECQAWVKVSNSLLGILDILVIAHDDEGNIGFDKIIDLQSTMSYSLSFRWTLFTWAGADGLATADALKGSGGSTNDITSSVTAVYGWDPAAQAWLGYFPSAVPVPGANDLTKLTNGDAYWIAITGPGSVTWTIATNVD